MTIVRIVCACLLALLLVVASAGAQKKYGVKSGIVTFETSVAILGKPAAQKQILYFEDYGAKERKETYDGEVLEEASVCDGTHLYTLVFAESTAYRGGASTRGTEAAFGRDTVKGRTWKKLADQAIAGRVCETLEGTGPDGTVRLAGWKGIVLLAEGSDGGIHTSIRAVKVAANAAIPAEKFRVPPGFTVK
jgi:hypothetical protein